MTNIRFDEVELSTYGFALGALDGRSMADWNVESVVIPGRQSLGDVSTNFDPGQTKISGFLSADTEDWEFHTHEEFLTRLREFKGLLNPRRGFRKLVVSGDDTASYRWVRFQNMSMTEVKPVNKVPFQQVDITFQNYEPYWRQQAAIVLASTYPLDIPNSGHDDTRPLAEISIAETIEAFRGARVQPVTLFQIDDLQVQWRGLSSNQGALLPGDLLMLDSETLTAIVRSGSGVGTPVDVVRHYDYAGPGAYGGNGFPIVQRGGSIITYIHPRVARVSFTYDLLFL